MPGFASVFLGIETPDESSLIANHKLQNTKRDLLESVQRIQQYGIEVMGGFILGFDTDQEDIFDRMVDFIQKSAIPLAMVGLLQAMPGTQLFRRLRNEGRILDAGDGDNTDCKLNFLPRMDAARLVEGYRSVLKRIYSCDAYYERVELFLSRCHPQTAVRLRYANLRAMVLSVVHQGVLGKRSPQLLEVPVGGSLAVSPVLWSSDDIGGDGLSLPGHDRTVGIQSGFRLRTSHIQAIPLV